MLAQLGLLASRSLALARCQPGSGFVDPLEVPSNTGAYNPLLAGEETEPQREAHVPEITKPLEATLPGRAGLGALRGRIGRWVTGYRTPTVWARIQAPLLMICLLPGLNFTPVKWAQ